MRGVWAFKQIPCLLPVTRSWAIIISSFSAISQFSHQKGNAFPFYSRGAMTTLVPLEVPPTPALSHALACKNISHGKLNYVKIRTTENSRGIQRRMPIGQCAWTDNGKTCGMWECRWKVCVVEQVEVEKFEQTCSVFLHAWMLFGRGQHAVRSECRAALSPNYSLIQSSRLKPRRESLF